MADAAALITAARRMLALGLTQGTSGNLSLRAAGGMLITPSAVPYETLTPEMIPLLPLDGASAFRGAYRPSSEWRFHRDILAARPEVGAVIHNHAPYATGLAHRPAGDPGLPLHDRAVRRCADPLRALRAVRDR